MTGRFPLHWPPAPAGSGEGARCTLGVLGDGPPPPGVVPLLTAARRWCTVATLTQEQHDPVDAVLATRPDLLPLQAGPAAVCVETPDDLERAEVREADVVLSSDTEVLSRAGPRGLRLPYPGRPLGAAVLVPPFVRQRLRASRQVPTPLIIERDGDGWVWTGGPVHLSPAVGATAVALASAAIIVDWQCLLEAMAWGTPCVTDRKTAQVTGACPEREVLVADGAGERRALSLRLAGDERLAARLSRTGHSLATSQDPARVAARLLRRLWLAPATRLPGPAAIAVQLSELGTPEDAVVAERVLSAVAALAGGQG
jgi:hypothetical protein